MKTLKLTEKAWKILSEYKIWGYCKSFSETIEYMDLNLQNWIPNDHIWKRKNRK